MFNQNSKYLFFSFFNLKLVGECVQKLKMVTFYGKQTITWTIDSNTYMVNYQTRSQSF